MIRKTGASTRMPKTFWVVVTLSLVALFLGILFSVYYSGSRIGFQ